MFLGIAANSVALIVVAVVYFTGISLAQSALRPASKVLTIELMFIGASPGGTGGGIKTTTFVILVLAVLASTRGEEDVSVFGRRIAHASVYRAMAVMLAGLVILA